MKPAAPPKPDTLRAYVANYIKQAILEGQYRPGDRLIEREICELLQVSRPPVREALRDLEADKLISKEPYRGPVVASIGYEDALQLYAYRTLLEGYAAAEFSKLATDEEIAALGRALKELHAATKNGAIREILEVVGKFYDIIFTGCRNQLVKESLLKLMDRINLLRVKSMANPQRHMKSYQEFEGMYQRIKARDYKGAQEATCFHVQEASKIALATLEKAK